jgi:hypothetical protein
VRFRAFQQALHLVNIAAVGTQHPVSANQPQIARAGYWLDRGFRDTLFQCLGCPFLAFPDLRQQNSQFVVAEAQQFQIDIGILQFRQLGP